MSNTSNESNSNRDSINDEQDKILNTQPRNRVEQSTELGSNYIPL